MSPSRRVKALAASVALVGAYAVGSVTGVTPATAQQVTPAEDGVTVAGLGTVSGTPDVLRLSVRVVVIRPDATRALSDANVVTSRLRTVLKQHGVAVEDIATTQLNIGPSYSGRPPHLAGYQVVQGVAAQLRKLSDAGPTVTDVIAAGGRYLRFDGVSFTLSDDSPLKVTARDKAFAQAKDKAEQYAKLSGRTLGPVQSVSEDAQPQYYYCCGDFAFGAAAPAMSTGGGSAGNVAFDPGSQRIDVRVVVRWSLA